MTAAIIPARQAKEARLNAIKTEVIDNNVVLTISFCDGTATTAQLTPDEAIVLGDWLTNDALMVMMESNPKFALPVDPSPTG